MFAPTSKWGKRGGSSSAPTALSHLTSRGKAVELDKKKSASAYVCPDKQMGKARRQFLSPHSFIPFDLEGQGGGARQKEKRKRLCLLRQANGESEANNLKNFCLEPKMLRAPGVFGSFFSFVALEKKWLVNYRKSLQELPLLPHRHG